MKYGTIARMRVRPGAEAFLRAQLESLQPRGLQGWLSTTLYRSDRDPQDMWMVVAFESEEAYKRNAARENMDAVYRRLRSCLEQDPEWNDGFVISEMSVAQHP